MASIVTILSEEKLQNRVIHLYKEGIFLKAYSYSAFLFITYLKAYSIQTRYFKIVSRWVSSLGFPSDSLDNLTKGYTILQREDGVDILIDKAIDEESYLVWEQDCISKQKKSDSEKVHPEVVVSSTAGYDQLHLRILSFDLENKTPIECALFLAEIQRQLRKEINTVYLKPEPI